MTCQQLIKQDSERIDIRGICNWFPAHLFRAGVFGRHWPPIGSGKRRVWGPLRVEHLGDAKIQETGYALFSDQDVAGLEITMDDEGFMGVLHCEADGTEQLQTFGNRQSVIVAIFVDANTLDVIHD